MCIRLRVFPSQVKTHDNNTTFPTRLCLRGPSQRDRSLCIISKGSNLSFIKAQRFTLQRRSDSCELEKSSQWKEPTVTTDLIIVIIHLFTFSIPDLCRMVVTYARFFLNMSVTITYIWFHIHAQRCGAHHTTSSLGSQTATSAGVIFHTDSRDRTSFSLRRFKQCESVLHTCRCWAPS